MPGEIAAKRRFLGEPFPKSVEIGEPSLN